MQYTEYTAKGKKIMSANTNIKQVVIVTGASGGIGLGITQALLEHSYRVIANSLTISTFKDLKPLFGPRTQTGRFNERTNNLNHTSAD